MKYTMVKQFSNGALDNIFNFWFKIIDFGKLLLDALWGFAEIWIAFFLIFYNLFMYVYYFFLYLIDRGAEETGPKFSLRKNYTKKSSAPKLKLSQSPNPIPAAYRTASDTIKQATSTVKDTSENIRNRSKKTSTYKRNIFERMINAFGRFFVSLKKVLLSPFHAISSFFEKRLKPVPAKESKATKGSQEKRSLIDDYLKEFEQSKK